MDSKIEAGGITKQLVIVTLTLITICLGYPLAILLLIPLLVYRHFVEILVKFSDPRFGSTLKGLDALMSAKTLYSKPRSLLIPVVYLDKEIDKKFFIHCLNERILQARDNKGNLIYSRLRQKIVAKFGYHFWYNVDSFNIREHVNYLDESYPERVINQGDMTKIVTELTKRPLNSERSPWEFLLIPRFQREEDATIKSVLIFRFHHCLGDGLSIRKILERMSDHPWDEKVDPTKKPKKHQTRLQILPTLRLLVQGPYELLKEICFSEDKNLWLQRMIENPSGNVSSHQSDFISIETLKNIGKARNVNFVAILLAIFVQAVAKGLKRCKIISGNKTNIHVVFPLPMPNHPRDGLSNNWTVAKFSIPVDLHNVETTVENVNKQLKQLRASPIFLQTFWALANFMGSLPIRLIEKGDGGLTCSSVFSNFPGPSHSIDLCGYGIRDMYVGGSGTACALSSVALSYNGKLRCFITGDKCNISQEDANFLAQSCTEIVMELEDRK